MPAPLIIAHRGLPKAWPENTLESYRAALQHKPDVVECDYHHSSDGMPFVIHDATLDRTTNADETLGRKKIAVSELTAAELARLDAGSWFKANPQPQARLSTLEAIIDAVTPQAVLMIERKGGDAGPLVDLLRKKDCFDRVVVQAFEWDFIADCHQRESRITLGCLGEKELTAGKIAKAVEIGATLVGWDQKTLTPAEIAAAHAAGLKVWSWTVNDPEKAKMLVDAGLDGVITDRCDVVREWLK